MSVRERNSLVQELKQEGLLEGLQKKAKDIARKMLEKGYDLEEIQSITELSIEDLEELKEPQVGVEEEF